MLNDKDELNKLRNALDSMMELLKCRAWDSGDDEVPEWIGGLQFDFGKISFARDGKDAKVTLTILSEEQAKLPKWERDMPDCPVPFFAHGQGYQVSKADLGRTATIGDTTYRFLGMAPKNRKYPWILATATGTVKVTNESMGAIVRAWRG